MATTGTKTRKAKTNTTEETSKVVEEQQEEKRVLPKRLDNYAKLVVKSNFDGVTLYNKQTGANYKFEKAGFTQVLLVEDINYLRQSSIGIFAKKWITIVSIEEDDLDWIQPKDIYSILRLDQYFSEEDLTKDLKQLLRLSKQELINKIDSMDKKTFNAFKKYVSSLSEDEVDNLANSVVKVLNTKLGIEL